MANASASRPLRWPVIIAAVVLVAAVAAIVAYLRITAHATNKPVKLSSLYWVYYREDLLRLQPLDPAIVGQTLSGPGTYALEHNNTGPPLPAGVIPVALYFSYADEQAALKNKQVPAGATALADDPEDWPATPLNEQQNPLPSLKSFGLASKAAGYATVLIPGRDLMSVSGAVCNQQKGETISQAYVRCGLPSAAANASVYVIQSAALETDIPAMTQLVQQAAAAARAANPSVKVIATISTAPNGSPVGATTVNQAARAVLPYVQGFEVNTTAPTDSRFIAFLHDLAGS